MLTTTSAISRVSRRQGSRQYGSSHDARPNPAKVPTKPVSSAESGSLILLKRKGEPPGSKIDRRDRELSHLLSASDHAVSNARDLVDARRERIAREAYVRIDGEPEFVPAYELQI